MQIRLKVIRDRLAVVLGTLLIGACAFQAAPLTEQEQIERLEQLIDAGGYYAARQYQIESFNETWSHDGEALEVSISAPAEPGAYPVIVYLPGLGEHADSGRLWRENWAKAGYLVFAVQTTEMADALADLKASSVEKNADGEELAEDSRARKRLQSLRNSDLRYIGHQSFSSQSVEQRVTLLLWAYGQFKQRCDAGSGLFARADLSKMFVVGYDIGAQTTAALIGEHTIGVDLPENTGFDPLGAILISPSVDPAQGNIARRYGDIKMPFLVITSETDKDPYGISSPHVRTAMWEYAPAGQHYLLLLKNATHRLLAGSDWSDRSRSKDEERRSDEWMPGFANQLDRDGGSRHERGGGGRDVGSPSHRRQAGVEPYRSVAAVFSVSTAFLDSIAKADNFAQLWLTDKAMAWLDKAATLKSK